MQGLLQVSIHEFRDKVKGYYGNHKKMWPKGYRGSKRPSIDSVFHCYDDADYDDDD